MYFADIEKTGETDSIENPKSIHGTPFRKVAVPKKWTSSNATHFRRESHILYILSWQPTSCPGSNPLRISDQKLNIVGGIILYSELAPLFSPAVKQKAPVQITQKTKWLLFILFYQPKPDSCLFLTWLFRSIQCHQFHWHYSYWQQLVWENCCTYLYYIMLFLTQL